MVVQLCYLRAWLVLSCALGVCQRSVLRGSYLRRMKSTHVQMVWLSQEGVERCPRSHRVELCYNSPTLHIGQLSVMLSRLHCKTDFRINYLRGSDYFSVDGSMSWRSCTSLVKFLTAHTMIQSKMPPNAQGHAHGRFSILTVQKNLKKVVHGKNKNMAL